jgi:hypothetical protein
VIAGLGLGAIADNGVFVDQAGGRGDFCHELLQMRSPRPFANIDREMGDERRKVYHKPNSRL